jgi:nitrite reductase/ring-hydroxylating ferredoxin subunit
MASRHRLTSVDTVREEGSWVFTVRDEHGSDAEFLLVPCEGDDQPAVRAWANNCTHEAQRLHREGVGAVVRNGEIICPKHGSMFDTCSGYCGNGDAADTTLPSVDIEVDDGQVYLTDEGVRFLYEGTNNDEDDGPSSTSHLQF